MKYLMILLAVAATALLGCSSLEEKLCENKQGEQAAMTGNSLNIFNACTLTDKEMAERKKMVQAEVWPSVAEIKELESGYAFRFPKDSELLPKVLTLIQLESQCCSFLTFNLRVEAHNGSIWLDLTGDKHTKSFIKQTFLQRR